MEKFKKFATPILTTLITLLPIVYGLIIWDKLPEQVPTHWNAAGEIDGYSSKAFAVFGLPAFLAVINLVCQLAMKLDPKQKNHSEKVKALIVWLVPVISIIMVPVTFAAAQGIEVDIVTISMLMCGVIFLIIGNYLPKCRQNYTIGIKISWTLESEENWNRTHRFAGFIWIIGAIIIIIATFLGYPLVMLPVVLIMSIVPVVYSYMLYRKGI